MIRLLNKVLTSYFWIIVGGKAHNNMPELLFVNSISFCQKELSLEKNTLKSLHGLLHYTSMENKHGFLLTNADTNVLVRVYPTGIESSLLSGNEILAMCFWITDDSDRCSVEMQVHSFMKAVKIVPKTTLFWIQYFDSLWRSTVTSKIWCH